MKELIDPAANESTQGWSPLLVRIYLESYDRLVTDALRIVNDRALAEDCVQDAILRFHTKGAQPRMGSELAYIRSMVRNGAISKVRSESRRREALRQGEASSAPAEAHAVSKIVAAEIATCVAKLAPRQSEVIDLRFGGMSVAESAAALSVSSGTIKTHRHRAAEALRDSLRDLLVA